MFWQTERRPLIKGGVWVASIWAACVAIQWLWLQFFWRKHQDIRESDWSWLKAGVVHLTGVAVLTGLIILICCCISFRRKRQCVVCHRYFKASKTGTIDGDVYCNPHWTEETTRRRLAKAQQRAGREPVYHCYICGAPMRKHLEDLVNEVVILDYCTNESCPGVGITDSEIKAIVKAACDDAVRQHIANNPDSSSSMIPALIAVSVATSAINAANMATMNTTIGGMGL